MFVFLVGSGNTAIGSYANRRSLSLNRQHRPRQQHPQSTCITILQRQWLPSAQYTYSHTASSTVNSLLYVWDNIIQGPYTGQIKTITLIILATLLYGELPHVNAIKTQSTIQCSLVIKHTNYFNILSLKTQWPCLHAHHKISVLKKMFACSTTIGIFLYKCNRNIPNSYSFLGIIDKLLPIIMLHLR